MRASILGGNLRGTQTGFISLRSFGQRSAQKEIFPYGTCSRSLCIGISYLTWEQSLKHSDSILSASIFPSGWHKGSLERRPRRKERRHGHPEMIIISTITAWESFEIPKYPCTLMKSHTERKVGEVGPWVHLPLRNISKIHLYGAPLTENKLEIVRMMSKTKAIKRSTE